MCTSLPFCLSANTKRKTSSWLLCENLFVSSGTRNVFDKICEMKKLFLLEKLLHERNRSTRISKVCLCTFPIFWKHRKGQKSDNTKNGYISLRQLMFSYLHLSHKSITAAGLSLEAVSFW